jgi:hypothetical protein
MRVKEKKFRILLLTDICNYDFLFRLFQEDVKQVLDWLTNHGEVFIRKNTGVGRNLQKARVYQKSHEHFENVAQVIL